MPFKCSCYSLQRTIQWIGTVYVRNRDNPLLQLHPRVTVVPTKCPTTFTKVDMNSGQKSQKKYPARQSFFSGFFFFFFLAHAESKTTNPSISSSGAASSSTPSPSYSSSSSMASSLLGFFVATSRPSSADLLRMVRRSSCPVF